VNVSFETDRLPYAGPVHVGREILCVEHLSYRYGDGTEALKDVSLHVQTGSTLAIIGPNGAGKTTLLKILLGLLEGYEGKVTVAGMTPRDARRAGNVVGWVPQRPRMAWDFPATIGQVVRMGLVGKTGLLRQHRRDDLDYVRHVMDLLDISDIADRPVHQASGGQQQRAIIARALAPRPAVLMLDEPTVGVDEAGQQAFASLMRHIQEACGVTLVTVTHDLRAVLPDVERVACLNCALHFHDSPARLTPQVLGQVFRCDLTGLFVGGRHDQPRGGERSE
jgi:zinc transport system ATP-binding protein